MMISLRLLIPIALTVALASRSMQIAPAADAIVSGWRNGVSTWNGTEYESTELNSTDARSTVAPYDPNGQSNDRPPYTVPIAPGIQANPYYSSTTIDELQQALARSPETQPDIANVDSSPAHVSAATTDPYANSRTPTKPANLQSTATDGTTTENAFTESTLASERDKIDLTTAFAEQPPLQQEVVHWYEYPQRWMQGWDSNAEFGIDGSNGNARTFALQTGLELKRKTDIQTIAIDIDYRQASTNKRTSENNGRVNVDYDRMIADSSWSLFGKFGMEWDQFKAFDLRLNLNSGLGYHWIRQQNASLVTRFGAGASREIGAPIDRWTPEAVFGVDSERQLNSRNKVTAKMDYFPAWEDFSDYRLVADAAWEILLDDSDNLSLKLAVTDRYDSTPQGAKPNDVYYSLLMLYKF